MNFFRKLNENSKTSNLFLAVLAGIIAICVWLFIALNQYPTVQKTIYHIPVTTDISGSVASQNGLKVISCDVKEVTVELLCSRTKIGYINSDSLTAYFDADNVSSAGTKKLGLKIRSDNGYEFDVQSVSPPSASINFDKIDTREFEIKPLTPNIEIAEGKQINNEKFICTPSVISITGPSAQLDKIKYCYAVSNKKETISSTVNYNCDEIQLFTEEKAMIDTSGLQFNDTNISISIHVRNQKTVPIYVSIANAPENFDQSIIKFKLSADNITLAGNNSQVEIPDKLDIGFVPLYEIKPGFVKTFSVATRLEGSDLINVSDLENVTVTFEDEGLKEASLTINKSRIKISNPPDSSYNYDIITQQMNVTVIGSEESISQITAEDIIGDVNLLNMNISADQFNQNVNFSCPAFDDVWVASNTKASINRTKIEPTTSSEPAQ